MQDNIRKDVRSKLNRTLPFGKIKTLFDAPESKLL